MEIPSVRFQKGQGALDFILLLDIRDGVQCQSSISSPCTIFGTYCPGDEQGAPPPEFDTCLGDLYSVAWMEDSDAHNLRAESLRQQYGLVRDRTSPSSHVMQYGDLALDALNLSLFMGTDPANDNATVNVNQRDADLVYFWRKYRRAAEKGEARRQLLEMMARRSRVGGLLFGAEEGPKVLHAVRPPGEALADDWDCLKAVVRSFEARCGSLAQYGMKRVRSFANICNAGVGEDAMAKVATQACATIVDLVSV